MLWISYVSLHVSVLLVVGGNSSRAWQMSAWLDQLSLACVACWQYRCNMGCLSPDHQLLPLLLLLLLLLMLSPTPATAPFRYAKCYWWKCSQRWCSMPASPKQ
jgi:hypothetical protein